MILDELDPAVLEQLTERERQELIAASEGLQGSALQTHMASAHPAMPAPAPQRLPRLNLEPGQMFSYSTQGPGRFNPDTDIAVGTPSGDTVYAPGNAQNISMVQGPAGPTEAEQVAARNEEAQRQAFAQMMSGIPLKNFKDAQTATQMAIRFNADRQYQALVNKGVPVNEAVMRVAPMYAAAGIPLTGAANLYAPASKRILNAGGRLYQVNPVTGETNPLTEPPGITPAQSARAEIDKQRLEMARAAAEQAKAKAAEQSNTARAKAMVDLVQATKTVADLDPSMPGYAEATNSLSQASRILNKTEEQEPEPEELKPLDRVTAQKILKEAKGDKAKARQIAKERGYTF